MFSEAHYKILQALLPEGSSPQAIADKVGLPVALTSHLLEELNSYEFVKVLKELNDFADLEVVYAYLKTKGEAAVTSPDYFIGKPMNPQSNNCTGDRIAGDKIGGDKVMGNKVQIGTVQGDAIAGDKITQSQNLAEAAKEIKDLIAQLKLDYPNDDDFTQAGRTVGAITNNPTLKKRLINAAKESGTTAVEKAIESVVNNPAVSIVVAGVKGFIDA
jgi:hypothetical protein